MILHPTQIMIALTLLLSSMTGAFVNDDSTESLDAMTAFGEAFGEDMPKVDQVSDRVMDRAAHGMKGHGEKLQMIRERTADRLMMLEAYADVENRTLGDEELSNATARTGARLAIIDACISDSEDCQMRDLRHRMKAGRDHVRPSFDERLDRAEQHATIKSEMVDACREDADCTVDGEQLDEMAIHASKKLEHINDCRADIDECQEKHEQKMDERKNRGHDRRQHDMRQYRMR